MSEPFIHPTAVVDDGAILEAGTKVWHFVHVRGSAVLRADVSLGRDVYVDAGVEIGEGTHVQNGVSIYSGVSVGRWCFIGPHAIFTNDNRPRAGNSRWTKTPTSLEDGCSIGAGSVIRCGVTIGAYAMVGAGTIVTRSIAPFQLVVGTPGVPTSLVCACGETFFPLDAPRVGLVGACCREIMHPKSLALAQEVLARLGPSA